MEEMAQAAAGWTVVSGGRAQRNGPEVLLLDESTGQVALRKLNWQEALDLSFALQDAVRRDRRLTTARIS